MTALLLALLAAVMEAGAGLALWAAGMSALPVAIVLHGLASLLAAGGLARRTRPDERLYVFGTVLALLAAAMEGGAGLVLWAAGMSGLPVAIVLHGLASLVAVGSLARRTRLDVLRHVGPPRSARRRRA